MKSAFRSTVSFALTAGMGLIVLSIATSYFTINALISDAQRETSTHETAVLLERVVSRFKNAESQQRRYVLTGSAQDLASYGQARLEIQQALQRVHEARSLADERQDLRDLDTLLSHRIALMEQTVATRQQAGLEAATVLVGSEVNRRADEDIESLIGRMKNADALASEHSKQETRRSAQIVRLFTLLGGLLSVAVLGWAILMIVRSQARYRRTETQLSDSEAMNRAITESMAEGVVTASQEGSIVNVNAAARYLFGYRREELVGKNVTLLLPPRYQMGFAAFFSSLADRAPGFRESDTRVLGQRRDGAEFPVNVSFSDLTIGGRRLFTAIIRDTTESSRSAQALRDSEEQLRQLTDNVPALIAYFDSEQRFKFHNKAYEEAFGLSAAQIHDRTMLEVMGPELYATVRSHVAEVLGGYTARYERSQTTASGEQREYVMHYFPRYGENGDQDKVVGFYSLGHDVTELKRIDRMKSEFVSTVSHELRTPLTSIRGSLGLVWGGVAGELPEKAKNLVGIAKNNCERLIRLVNEILDSEKIESGKMRFELRPVELAYVLEQAVATNEGFASQHGVTLTLRAMREPVRVNVDSDRLVQVVTNLLSNAIKFSPAGDEVKVLARRESGWLRIEVSDHGPGIPEAFRKQVFQKFSQADSSDTRQKGGTGLGLNISRAIIERMEGRIGFATETGVGTTFFVELPEWREAPPVTAPASLYELGRPRVLVYEEDPDVAQLIGMMLDKGGFDADMAHTTGQARDYLKMESYAAMTLDIKPPYDHGLGLIREIRQEKRTVSLPALVLSVTPEEVRLQGDQEALAISGWLAKPLDEQRLLECLRNAIQHRHAGKRASTS